MKYLYFISFVFIISIVSCINQEKTDQIIDLKELKISVDTYEVSIGNFRKFINATQYQTTSDRMKWSGVYNTNTTNWDVVENANWEKPDGLNFGNRNLPVTHVSYMDACAYCEWKNGRLPSAEEWDQIAGKEVIKGNVWEGPFPHMDTGEDGYAKTVAPVGKFQANKNGIHDLFGNVWEWTTTHNAKGEMIIKGGSFLCDISFCSGYIPSKYQTTLKDSGLNHLGFRCVYE